MDKTIHPVLNPDADCKEVHQYLYEYLDQEVEVEELIRIRKHLKNCIGCNELVEFEEKLWMVIREKGRHTKCPNVLKDQLINMLKKL